MERVLHPQVREARSTSAAARLVGDAHERAAETKTTSRGDAAPEARRTASGAPEEDGASGARHAPAANAAANAETPRTPHAPGGGARRRTRRVFLGGPGGRRRRRARQRARDSGSESDWSSSDAEDDARATASAASVDRGAIRAGDFPRAQADDDWLEGMMTRYAASEAGESARGCKTASRSEDAVFADGLALLAHSMRAPLRRGGPRPRARRTRA